MDPIINTTADTSTENTTRDDKVCYILRGIQESNNNLKYIM